MHQNPFQNWILALSIIFGVLSVAPQTRAQQVCFTCRRSERALSRLRKSIERPIPVTIRCSATTPLRAAPRRAARRYERAREADQVRGKQRRETRRGHDAEVSLLGSWSD